MNRSIRETCVWVCINNRNHGQGHVCEVIDPEFRSQSSAVGGKALTSWRSASSKLNWKVHQMDCQRGVVVVVHSSSLPPSRDSSRWHGLGESAGAPPHLPLSSSLRCRTPLENVARSADRMPSGAGAGNGLHALGTAQTVTTDNEFRCQRCQARADESAGSPAADANLAELSFNMSPTRPSTGSGAGCCPQEGVGPPNVRKTRHPKGVLGSKGQCRTAGATESWTWADRRLPAVVPPQRRGKLPGPVLL